PSFSRVGRASPRGQLGLLPARPARGQRVPAPASRNRRRLREARRVAKGCGTTPSEQGAGRVQVKLARRATAELVGTALLLAAAHAMFGQALYSASRHARGGAPQLLGELIATFGLLSVIWGCGRRRPAAVPFAVGSYITAAYWFTSSTSFANPAVTLARAASDTFAGIRPTDVPGFIVAQALGAAAATALFRWLVPSLPAVAKRVVTTSDEESAA